MLLPHRRVPEQTQNNVVCLRDHWITRVRRENPVPEQPRHCGDAGPAVPASADDFTVLNFFDRMTFTASIEIDDLLWVRGHFSTRVRDQIVAAVRKLLCKEFGRRMIRRDALLLAVQHRDVGALIAGLLRVQFQANQILLPEYNVFGDRVEQNGVSVTWGVGRGADEARRERIKKRKHKPLRRG